MKDFICIHPIEKYSEIMIIPKSKIEFIAYKPNPTIIGEQPTGVIKVAFSKNENTNGEKVFSFETKITKQEYDTIYKNIME